MELTAQVYIPTNMLPDLKSIIDTGQQLFDLSQQLAAANASLAQERIRNDAADETARKLVADNQRLETANEELKADNTLLQSQLDAIDAVLPVYANGSILDSVKALLARIAELEKKNSGPGNSVPENPPIQPVPNPDKPETGPGGDLPLYELPVTIVDNGSYGDALTARLRGYIDKIASSDIRRVILFQNKQQMIQDEFPKVILDKGLQWDADTFWSVWRTTTPPERAKYLETAERLKVTAFHFDDAHNNKPEELADAVTFMRGYTDKPIYASFGADDVRIRDGKRESFDMQAYKDAGLLITRQFFRHEQVEKNAKAPTAIITNWLESGRILDGVNLEAFRAGDTTTDPDDFEDMLNKCLAAGVKFLSVYAIVDGAKWQMWEQAPALWAMVNQQAKALREKQKQAVKPV